MKKNCFTFLTENQISNWLKNYKKIFLINKHKKSSCKNSLDHFRFCRLTSQQFYSKFRTSNLSEWFNLWKKWESVMHVKENCIKNFRIMQNQRMPLLIRFYNLKKRIILINIDQTILGYWHNASLLWHLKYLWLLSDQNKSTMIFYYLNLRSNSQDQNQRQEHPN